MRKANGLGQRPVASQRDMGGSRRHVLHGLCATGGLLLATPALAHGFGQRFTLPLPFWLYGGGACAALLLSFVVLLWLRPVRRTPESGSDLDERVHLSAQASSTQAPRSIDVAPAFGGHSIAGTLWMMMSATLMLLAIVSGIEGSQVATANFSMTWFWIIYLLGFFYVAAVMGKRHWLLNPWWCASALLSRIRGGAGSVSDNVSVADQPLDHAGRASSSAIAFIGAWPAVLGYMLLIELELFGHASPMKLGIFLLVYTLAWGLVCITAGSVAWFRQCDVFGLMFDHISRLWPQGRTKSTRWSRLLEPVGLPAQMLIIAMLAATAFDALRESVPWATQLWRLLLTLYPQDNNPLAILAALSETYRRAEMLAWLVMPLLYWLLMALMVALSRRMAPVRHAFSKDMGLAAIALLPLVLGYHLAHYFPLLLSESPNILHLLSDPLGEGWNLFGTANRWRAPIMMETDTVWHLQVALIVAGHLGGVVVSHWQATQMHATHQAIVRSQLPMLVWMMALTTWGLWILSQPMKIG